MATPIQKLFQRPWYDEPILNAIPKLIEMRNQLRKENLYDTEDAPLTGNLPIVVHGAPESLERSADGTYNALDLPRMGSAGCRFGRNVPLADVVPDNAHLLAPSPRDVSRQLMTREQFQPVPFLNLLAASWIQFQTHDWFAHGRDESPENPRIQIPLDAADPWPEHPMQIPCSPKDPTRTPESTKPPTYVNHVTHWWDGSQIYGSDAATNAKVRTGVDGKLKIQDDGKLPVDPDTGIDLTGFFDNWWIGLSMLHGLFVAEHNSICDALKAKYPAWDDHQLYAKARLINVALMAKIHTIEWTPAIMPHPTIRMAMYTNWYGAFNEFGEQLKKLFPDLNDSELLGGIIGGHAEQHAAPYSLTEEFVSVYRMHPLMPDQFEFVSASSGAHLATHELPEVAGVASRPIFDSMSMTDLFYSFGQAHPGMIRLHNYPKHLQNLRRDNGMIFDMASVDIVRDRERGVPRYNKFRELFHMPRVDSFDKLTDNPQWAEELRRVYNNDIDAVDLMVGLYAEPLPKGFGFSETAFRVFILMASRRLKSDRFFTDDYRPEIYTDTGLEWIEKNGFSSVVSRHFPALAPALAGLDNPFNPWNKVQ